MRAINDVVNLVLSETIQASQSGGSSHVRSDTCCMLSSYRACKKIFVLRAIKSLLTQFETQKHSDFESKDELLTDEHIIKVQKPKLPWWSFFRKQLKKKVHPVSDEQIDEEVRLSPIKVSSGLSSPPQAKSSIGSKPSSQQNSTPLEMFDYVSEDEEFPAELTGNASPSHSISWSPTACLEDEVVEPENQKSPPLPTTETEVRSSSRPPTGDSGSGNIAVGTEQGVTNASDTEAIETQAEKSNRICPYCKRKMEDDPTASAQDEAVHTNRSSLLQRIWLFCCRQNCRSRSDLAIN
ncbi:uncharacterized protein LOC117939167 [Etheostoma cragini]|uniref:uncharacterized protein LOC117939167 n=1 Tax=Etheostoma cragini TaxID=417921 RepID=UPI00155F49DB|nr:uncharacterized protein LOC117939167 [Etheostoma cragini]